MEHITPDWLFHCGIILIVVSLILILVACVFMALSKRRLARKLNQEYGVAPGKGGRI